MNEQLKARLREALDKLPKEPVVSAPRGPRGALHGLGINDGRRDHHLSLYFVPQDRQIEMAVAIANLIRECQRIVEGRE